MWTGRRSICRATTRSCQVGGEAEPGLSEHQVSLVEAGAVVRILIPDHPDLYRVPGRAVEFADVLCHANDPAAEDGVVPWQLPEQLTAPELEQALNAAVVHPW